MIMKPLKVYACYNIDQNIRLSSSSGAVFSALADYVCSLQGIVYGVAMSEDCYSAKFIRVIDKNELIKLRGSKYLQAQLGNTYKKVKEDVLSGKLVLFSGTGCQINGLKNFLGKDFDNLICMDVICHGTPSPALWRKYVQYQEGKNGGKLKYINFRCKDNSWTDFGMSKILEMVPKSNLNSLYNSMDKDPYMQMFLRDYCLRPSCYNCAAKMIKMSDLTIADFWGINMVAEEMNDGKGVSLVLIRTEKGREVFKKISGSMKMCEVDYESSVACNPAEYKSCERPMQRETFFEDMRSMSFEKLERKYLVPVELPLKSRIKRKIKYFCTKSNIFKKLIAKNEERITNDLEYGLFFMFYD